MNLVRVRYKSYERKLPSSSNKSFPSLLLTVDVQNGVSAATDTVTNKVSAQIVDIRPKGISSAGSVANWVTLHGTASSRVTIGRGIAGALAADFIWFTSYTVPSTVLDSTLSHIFAM